MICSRISFMSIWLQICMLRIIYAEPAVTAARPNPGNFHLPSRSFAENAYIFAAACGTPFILQGQSIVQCPQLLRWRLTELPVYLSRSVLAGRATRALCHLLFTLAPQPYFLCTAKTPAFPAPAALVSRAQPRLYHSHTRPLNSDVMR